jgi:ABC-2 type transport system permease protein
MFGSIFTKTIYEKRWGLFWWSFAMFAFTLMIVLMFPVFQDSFAQQMDAIPESLKSIVGEASDYSRIEGFLELQMLMQMVFLTFIYAIILFAGLIAGDESDGKLQSLLVQPVSRTKVYFQKMFAGITLLIGVSLAMLLAAVVGAAMIGETLSLRYLAEGVTAQLIVSLVLGLLAYMIGSAKGQKGLAGALAGVFAFAGYMVTALEPTVEVLKYPNYLSPFKYFNNTGLLDAGMKLENMAPLLIACLVFAVVGWLVFVRRDVGQN